MFILRGGETHSRSVLKAISWRTLGTLDTFAISWFMTGKIAMAGSIAGLEIVTKVLWYYLHERIWAAISWGRSTRIPFKPHAWAMAAWLTGLKSQTLEWRPSNASSACR